MSVRNRYAGNYTKIAPFPPSTRTINEARVSSKRHNDTDSVSVNRRSRIKQAPPDLTDDENENIPMYKQRKSKDSYNVTKTEGLRRQGTEMTLLSGISPRERRRNKKETQARALVATAEENRTSRTETTDDKKGKANKTESKQESSAFSFHAAEHSTTLQHQQKHKNQPAESNNNSRQHQQLNQPESDSDVTVRRPLRPKSARPESRWERRHNESPPGSPMIERQTNRQARPMSARPDSRMQRNYQSDGAGEEIERPKTSHGRRALEGRVNYIVASSSESEQLDGILYQYQGPESIKYDFDSDESLEELHKFSSKKRTNAKTPVKKNNRVKKSREYDMAGKQPKAHYVADGFNMASAREEQIQLWRGNTLVDLNSRIDDIDLDVDPVLYFMQDDNLTTDRVNRKPSLSKDAIEYIGNAKSSHQSNNAISRHGNGPNKYSNKTEISDRSHSNRFSSLHNTVSECDKIPFNQDSNYWNKSNRSKRQPVSRDYTTHSRVDSKDHFGRMKPPLPLAGENYVRRSIAQSQVPRTAYDVATAKAFAKGENLPLRKPRKLQPLSMACNNE